MDLRWQIIAQIMNTMQYLFNSYLYFTLFKTLFLAKSGKPFSTVVLLSEMLLIYVLLVMCNILLMVKTFYPYESTYLFDLCYFMLVYIGDSILFDFYFFNKRFIEHVTCMYQSPPRLDVNGGLDVDEKAFSVSIAEYTNSYDLLGEIMPIKNVLTCALYMYRKNVAPDVGQVFDYLRGKKIRLTFTKNRRMTKKVLSTAYNQWGNLGGLLKIPAKMQLESDKSEWIACQAWINHYDYSLATTVEIITYDEVEVHDYDMIHAQKFRQNETIISDMLVTDYINDQLTAPKTAVCSSKRKRTNSIDQNYEREKRRDYQKCREELTKTISEESKLIKAAAKEPFTIKKEFAQVWDPFLQSQRGELIGGYRRFEHMRADYAFSVTKFYFECIAMKVQLYNMDKNPRHNMLVQTDRNFHEWGYAWKYIALDWSKVKLNNIKYQTIESSKRIKEKYNSLRKEHSTKYKPVVKNKTDTSELCTKLEELSSQIGRIRSHVGTQINMMANEMTMSSMRKVKRCNKVVVPTNYYKKLPKDSFYKKKIYAHANVLANDHITINELIKVIYLRDTVKKQQHTNISSVSAKCICSTDYRNGNRTFNRLFHKKKNKLINLHKQVFAKEHYDFRDFNSKEQLKMKEKRMEKVKKMNKKKKKLTPEQLKEFEEEDDMFVINFGNFLKQLGQHT
jgi:hypothetical protein